MARARQNPPPAPKTALKFRITEDRDTQNAFAQIPACFDMLVYGTCLTKRVAQFTQGQTSETFRKKMRLGHHAQVCVAHASTRQRMGAFALDRHPAERGRIG